MSNNTKLMRVHQSLSDKIDMIRAKCLLEGVKNPKIIEITHKIAEKINVDEMYYETFNRK